MCRHEKRKCIETERLNIKGQEIHEGNGPLREYSPYLESVPPTHIAQNDEGTVSKYRGTGMNFTVVTYGIVPLLKTIVLS